MEYYTEQIQRIKSKLIQAKKADKELKVFGASNHKYKMDRPTNADAVLEFEKKYSVQLPDCYKAFITNAGNGGSNKMNSGAGPFYGIYPLGHKANEFIDSDAEQHLKMPCIIYPEMTDEFWETAIKNNDEPFAGILPIGSQGCAYHHGIVLNGPFKGRVVNLDLDRQKPKFTHERNFLDWYERWLDEVISGELVKNSPSWFGYSKRVSEEELQGLYLKKSPTQNKVKKWYEIWK